MRRWLGVDLVSLERSNHKYGSMILGYQCSIDTGTRPLLHQYTDDSQTKQRHTSVSMTSVA
jgi:hypothetical protein